METRKGRNGKKKQSKKIAANEQGSEGRWRSMGSGGGGREGESFREKMQTMERKKHRMQNCRGLEETAGEGKEEDLEN